MIYGVFLTGIQQHGTVSYGCVYWPGTCVVSKVVNKLAAVLAVSQTLSTFICMEFAWNCLRFPGFESIFFVQVRCIILRDRHPCPEAERFQNRRGFTNGRCFRLRA